MATIIISMISIAISLCTLAFVIVNHVEFMRRDRAFHAAMDEMREARLGSTTSWLNDRN